MILPTTYFATLALLVLGLLFWGSWANTFKLAGNWRFELYYFDFALGVMITAAIAAFTLGSLGFDGFSFRDDLLHAGKKQDVYAFVAGGVFNLANMLLVAAMSLAGITVSFPIVMGLGLIVGVFFIFAQNPLSSPVPLFAGAAIILLALIALTQAYKQYKLHALDELVRTGQVKSTRKKVSPKATIVAIVGGLLMGYYIPLVQKCMEGDSGLGPYSVVVLFSLGILSSTFLFNLFLMNLPIAGVPLEIFEYFKGNLRQHAMGLLGGAFWCAGMLSFLVARAAEGPAAATPSLAQGLSGAAVILSALFGLFLWKEFHGAQPKVNAILGVMLALYSVGLITISLAPMVGR